MRLAQVSQEDAAIWIYPDAFPDASRVVALQIPEPNRLLEVWKVMNPAGSSSTIFEIHYLSGPSKARRKEDDGLVHLSSVLVTDLGNVSPSDRWKLAERWCQLRLQRNCNKEEVAKHKYLFSLLCDLAQESIAMQTLLAVVQENCASED